MVPANPAPLAILSAIYAQAGRFDEAIATLQAAAALSGQDPAAYRERLARLTAERELRQEQRAQEALSR
jgi:Flp pilus assembly protein TadD